jgi:hypothetical protein
MRNERLTVLEPIQVLSVMRVNRRLRVVAHDRTRRRHVLFFFVRTSRVARSHKSVITRWIHDRTSLAFVRGDRYGALVNIDALFAGLS